MSLLPGGRFDRAWSGHRADYAAAFVLAGASFGFRFLSFRELSNDHFIFLAMGQQVLLGEVPIRDFRDPGMPLMYLTSAAAQLVSPGILGEVLVAIAMLSTASAITYLLSVRASGSRLVAVPVTVLVIALSPRLYNYPKLTLYAFAIVLLWRYVDRPTRARAWALALITAVAFLFRHDHGVYIGVSAVATLALTRRAHVLACSHLPAYVAMLGVALLPFWIYVAWAGGVSEYLEYAVAFSRREAARTSLALPWSAAVVRADLASQWLYFVCLLLPVATALQLLRHRTRLSRESIARMAPLSLLLVCVDLGFLRDPLSGRLSDVSVPAAVVGAWLIAGTWRRQPDATRSTEPRRDREASRPSSRTDSALIAQSMVAVLVLLTIASVSFVGGLRDELDVIRIHGGPSAIAARAREVTATLTSGEPVWPGPNYSPVVDYLARCTTGADYVLVGWFAPEVPFFARRPFAGGLPVFGASFAVDPPGVLAVLARQSIPVVLLRPDEPSVFREVPAFGAWLERRYRRAGMLPISENQPVAVFTEAGRMPVRRYGTEALPCFGAARPVHSTAPPRGQHVPQGLTPVSLRLDDR